MGKNAKNALGAASPRKITEKYYLIDLNYDNRLNAYVLHPWIKDIKHGGYTTTTKFNEYFPEIVVGKPKNEDNFDYDNLYKEIVSFYSQMDEFTRDGGVLRIQ